MYAIKHYFPNGETLGDGMVKSGTRSDTVLKFTRLTEAMEAAADFTLKNSGHVFDVIELPAAPHVHTGFECGAL